MAKNSDLDLSTLPWQRVHEIAYQTRSIAGGTDEERRARALAAYYSHVANRLRTESDTTQAEIDKHYAEGVVIIAAICSLDPEASASKPLGRRLRKKLRVESGLTAKELEIVLMLAHTVFVVGSRHTPEEMKEVMAYSRASVLAEREDR